MAPARRQAKGKARLAAYEKLLAEEGREKIENIEIYIPPVRASATWSSKPTACARATATTC
jgi:hypothetical protein